MKLAFLRDCILRVTILLLACTSCADKIEKKEIVIVSNAKIIADSTQLYQEPFRPQFHFSPQKSWMNDPNGLVFYKGIYHLFYQYYPEATVWGPMHWGHATSTDLIHWQHKKIALFPDSLGLIFSGSVVVDFNNTSGLGTKENPPMVAIFTYHNMEAEKLGRTDFQTQGLAYSLDEGETWQKYKGNPIIKNVGIKDFRDPKAFWNPETNRWNLVLVVGNQAQFYTSKNLINWELQSEFGKDKGAHGGVWECPDVFKLKVSNTKEEKWVLLISVNPGAPNGGSGTQYFIGNFDGTRFTTNQKDVLWVDQGSDNYAGVTYNNTPKNERFFIGWMSNWSYARNTPTKRWRSAMTLPRELSLEKIGADYVLKSCPIKQLKTQLKQEYTKEKMELNANEKATVRYPNLNQSLLHFIAEKKDLTLVFSNEARDSLKIKYQADKEEFTIDRRHSGLVQFEDSFGKEVHNTKIPNIKTKTLEYQIVMDWSSIEIFLNGGLYCFTEQIFPTLPYTKLTMLSAENQKISSFTIQSVKGVWNTK